MTDKEKIHFLEFILRNIGDQLGINMQDFGHNEEKYLEEGKDLFRTLTYRIAELIEYEEKTI